MRKSRAVRGGRLAPLAAAGPVLGLAAGLAIGLSIAGCSDGPTGDANVDRLVGVTWQMVAVHTDQGTVTPAGAPPRVPSIEFTGELAGNGIRLTAHRLTGSGGCNALFGAYEATGSGALTVSDLAWTEMGCAPSEVMEVEQTFLHAVGRARLYRVQDDGLEIEYDGGTIELAADDG